MSKLFGPFALLLGVASLCSSVAGCSRAEGEAERVEVYPVTGKVTLAGAPVANASVTFSPKSGQPVALGRTDSQGVYKLTTYEGEDGAAAGDFVALVTKETVSPEKSGPVAHDPNNPYQPTGHGAPNRVKTTSALPTKYSSADQSDLAVSVKAEGENTMNLDLKP